MTTKLLTISLFLTLTASLAGCAGTQSTAELATTAAAGTILLSVNPETEVEYDGDGIVLEIEGFNDDGKTVLADYEGYKGNACAEVVNELDDGVYEFEFTSGGIEYEYEVDAITGKVLEADYEHNDDWNVWDDDDIDDRDDLDDDDDDSDDDDDDLDDDDDIDD